jgi:hypothetical protein
MPWRKHKLSLCFEHSINSHWVHAEASEAFDRNILVPLIFDGAIPPLEFRKIHSLTFDGWVLDPADPAGEKLVKAISRRTGSSGPVDLTDSSETIVSRLGSRLLAAKTSFELREGLYEVERFLRLIHSTRKEECFKSVIRLRSRPSQKRIRTSTMIASERQQKAAVFFDATQQPPRCF